MAFGTSPATQRPGRNARPKPGRKGPSTREDISGGKEVSQGQGERRSGDEDTTTSGLAMPTSYMPSAVSAPTDPAQKLVQVAEPQHQPVLEEKAGSTDVAPRRSMTRARKPSSRLLPSPSPPPARSSNQHQSGRSSALTTPTVPSQIKNMQKKQQAAAAFVQPTPQQQSTSPATAKADEADEEKQFGPGKRKRRPSTMTRPPSTITKQIVSSVATTSTSDSTNTPTLPSTGGGLKIRIGRVPSKSQSPEEKGQVSKDKGARRIKVEAQEVSRSVPDLTSSSASKSSGYESDGITEGQQWMTAMADADGDDEQDEDSDAGSYRALKVSNVRSKAHTLSAARAKLAVQRRTTGTGNTSLEPPPLIPRRGGIKAHHGLSAHIPPRTSKSTMTSSGGGSHLRAQSTSVLDSKWSWTPSAIAPTLRFRLAGQKGDDDVSEASDMDDEDDFHVAMLDGRDFGESHHGGKALSLSSKSSHRDSKSGDESEPEDTPATTPRSPQSTCDVPEGRWSTGAEDENMECRKGGRDAVFAHALEPSSHRPHTHAGALTLSLPFNEITQGSEEDATERSAMSGVSKAAKVEAVEQEEGHAVQEEQHAADDETNMEAGLLSPAVHPSILDLSSSKAHAALLLSSPHVSSAFASPALEGSNQGSKGEPGNLTLPPPLSAPRRAKLNPLARAGEPAVVSMGPPPNDDDEPESFEQTGISLEPPEAMCLSELDRAWEQSEHLVKALRVEDDTAEELERTKETPVSDAEGCRASESREETREPAVNEDPRPRRGAKRASLAFAEESIDGKKSKFSPRRKNAPPTPGRRSSRHSAVAA